MRIKLLWIQQKKNQNKASILYNEIDRNPNFEGTARKEDRSLMNVTFVPTKDGVEDKFLAACADAGCLGVKGHRSVGGFRASIYNALATESVETLVDVMKSI